MVPMLFSVLEISGRLSPFARQVVNVHSLLREVMSQERQALRFKNALPVIQRQMVLLHNFLRNRSQFFLCRSENQDVIYNALENFGRAVHSEQAA